MELEWAAVRCSIVSFLVSAQPPSNKDAIWNTTDGYTLSFVMCLCISADQFVKFLVCISVLISRA